MSPQVPAAAGAGVVRGARIGYPRSMRSSQTRPRTRPLGAPARRRLSGAAAPFATAGWVVFVLLAMGCATNQRRDVVPQETEQRSREFYGRQQRSMDGFNQTPSEQAGERHEQDARPVRPVEDER